MTYLIREVREPETLSMPLPSFVLISSSFGAIESSSPPVEVLARVLHPAAFTALHV